MNIEETLKDSVLFDGEEEEETGDDTMDGDDTGNDEDSDGDDAENNDDDGEPATE